MERFYTAKTEELAKEQAVNEFRALGIGENDITFEIVEQPVKKLFTMKGDYRIRAYAPDTAAAEPAAAEEPAAPAEADEAVSVSEAPEQKIAEVPEGVNVLESEKVQNAIRYLDKVLGALGVENYTIGTVQNDDTVVLDIVGEKLGVIVGRRGETLDAIQYLCSIIANKGDKDYYRITIDCLGYRSKRKETLEQLAAKVAKSVLRTGRSQPLEPMNPYERRVIHSAISNIEGVSSRSVGEEPYRKIIISSNNPRRGGGRRDNRRDGGRRNDRRGGERRNRDREVNMERRSVDLSTSFEKDYKRPKPEDEIQGGLYGKIEL
jgi:spoIIIJ-associated protein